MKTAKSKPRKRRKAAKKFTIQSLAEHLHQLAVKAGENANEFVGMDNDADAEYQGRSHAYFNAEKLVKEASCLTQSLAERIRKLAVKAGKKANAYIAIDTELDIYHQSKRNVYFEVAKLVEDSLV